ncbi:MAG TPA: hypothetical protein VFL80_02140, partial [Thermoanaerobaculia bacterium]|nr:hypothetical protein [Thermoanaerobaculia bacterium]
DDRWQSAHDIASELRWISEAGSQAGVATSIAMRRVSRERIAWAFAAIATLAAIAATLGYLQRAPQPEPSRRFVVPPPPHCSLAQFDELGLALAPDGQRLAFVAIDRNGRRQLWLRSFSEFEAKVLPETDGAFYPFWSPDGRFIAFFAEGKLKKIDSSGGPAQVICDAATGRGGSWGRDGTILFAPNVYSAIYAVGANGGTPKAVTRIDSATEVTHRWPQFLPDGKHFLYIVRPKTNSGGRGPGRLMLASLGSTSATKIMEEATNTVYSNGFLLFGREQRLMAQRFDLDSMVLSGDPLVLIGEKLSFWEPKNFVVFSATDSGSLVYLPETPPLADLRIVSRDGKTLETVVSNALLNAGASFAPGGSHIAYSLGDAANRREDIWIYDVARKRSSRFTFLPGSYWGITWSRDASRVYFAAAPQSMGNVYSKPFKGSAAIQPVVENGFWKMGVDPSPDGRTLVYAQQSGERGYDLWTVRPGQKPEMFLGTTFDEVDPRFSPDGKWIAYTSNESGRPEVYVRPAAGTTDQWQVSSAGGQGPRWSANGGELFYTSPDGKLFAVPVQPASSFEIGDQKELFSTTAPTNFYSGPLQDVSADGQRLLVITPADAASASMRVVFNWQTALQKQALQ